MRIVEGWVRHLHEVAVDNARSAATEASRRRVEAAEVEEFLSQRAPASPRRARFVVADWAPTAARGR